MTGSRPSSEQIRAVVRSSPDDSAQPSTVPWDQEGEFEIDVQVVNQRDGQILIKAQHNGQETYLTVTGFLPGQVARQRWRLICVRGAGKIELVDGECLEH